MKALKFLSVLVCFLFLGCAARLTQDQIKIVSDLRLYQLYIDENEKEYIDDIFVNFQKQVEKKRRINLVIIYPRWPQYFKECHQ
jgi:hypothetical protein